ncbi:MAG: hypothetical protein WB778_09835 [Thermoplasmata archaeon]
MTDPDVQAADAMLRRLAIPFVVVGGQAIAQTAATTTRDIDVLVATEDYGRTVELLRQEKGLAFDWDDGKLCRFRILANGGVPLDIINSSVFAGKRSGADFYRYLAEEASSRTDGVAYATPEAVWYTRLLTKRWRAYAEKIVTNMIDGVPKERLQAVEAIGRRFGTEATLAQRLSYVREELERPDIAELLRRAHIPGYRAAARGASDESRSE